MITQPIDDLVSPSRRRALRGLAEGFAVATLGAMSAEALARTEASTIPAATSAIEPFRVAVPQAAIDDLKRRLRSARLPEKETVGDWSQGVPLDKANALIAYWRDHYDWRRFERRINAIPQFRTEIDGLGIHFIHVRSKHPGALPMILTHGWPGSVAEFLDVIGPLTDPTAHGGRAEDAFDVVIPSLPGFAWSDKADETGWSVEKTASAWATLMQRLGYTRWVAQGGDWGSGVTHALAHLRPAGLVAAHVNWQFVVPEKLPDRPTPEEQVAIDGVKRFTGDGYGYFREQATRPQTIGYGLADSPLGQPPTLKAMQRGDVTTRFNVSRDLRNGRPAKHQAVVGDKVETGASGPRSTQIEVIGSAGPRRIILTGLNGQDAPHAGFLRNLRAYAAHLDAELRLYIVGSQSPGAGFSRDVRDLVRHETVTINDRIDIRPDLGLPRYSRFPLDGLQRVAPGRSAIVIHATPQLESLPRISAHPPRIQMTSGLASPSGRIVGHRVTGQPEQMGAVIIEIGDQGDVHARRITAMPERGGDFHDLDAHVAGGKVETRRRVEAIAFGDIHHPLTDPDVIAATWGRGGLIDRLRPRHQVLHDLADFHARNHHDARDHHARFRRFAAGRDDVRAELAGVSAFTATTRRPGCTTHVVASNHDHALTRWLRDGDHKADPRNAEFYLECERLAYAHLRDGRSAELIPEVLRAFARDRLDGVEFIGDGQSLMVAGVEHAVHGDRGPNGRRGSVAQFESMGVDMTIGHFHSPAIRGGIYVAGLCSNAIGYERGPTSRAVAHVITHSDGSRQHIFWDTGRYFPHF